MQLTQSTAGNAVVTYRDYDPLTGRIIDVHGGPSDSITNLSYSWDAVGNLLTRTDMLAVSGGQTEEFCYDLLNRLLNANLSNGTYCTGTGTTAMTYAASGNILTKTGVGTYSYGTNVTSGAGPHAITSIAGTVNGVTNPTYAYDADGNMLSGAGRTATYTRSTCCPSLRKDPARSPCFTTPRTRACSRSPRKAPRSISTSPI